jgi:hypothetical protein
MIDSRIMVDLESTQDHHHYLFCALFSPLLSPLISPLYLRNKITGPCRPAEEVDHLVARPVAAAVVVEEVEAVVVLVEVVAVEEVDPPPLVALVAE